MGVDRFQDPGGAMGAGLVDMGQRVDAVQQGVFGIADGHRRQAALQHRQVVERVARDQHAILGDVEMRDKADSSVDSLTTQVQDLRKQLEVKSAEIDKFSSTVSLGPMISSFVLLGGTASVLPRSVLP